MALTLPALALAPALTLARKKMPIYRPTDVEAHLGPNRDEMSAASRSLKRANSWTSVWDWDLGRPGTSPGLECAREGGV